MYNIAECIYLNSIAGRGENRRAVVKSQCCVSSQLENGAVSFNLLPHPAAAVV